MMKTFLTERHIGISQNETEKILATLGISSVEALIKETIPENILLTQPLVLPDPMTEHEYTNHITQIANQNRLYTTFIGQGWYGTATPAVIQRNVLENPSWYTSYTPYQAEISQGRLEALLNFQTVVSELTGMPLANASLLDEATAAAEAATMMMNLRSRKDVKEGKNILFVDEKVFPQTLAVIHTRAKWQGIEVEVADYSTYIFPEKCFGAIVQYPNAEGAIENYTEFVADAHTRGAKVAVAADILSLTLLKAPGEWDADIVFGSTQRFGIPLYFGGPSAAYFATREVYKRMMPGRIIGVSKDAYGKPALRMALQTREQHIKRDRATSNICTAQALLATMSGFYAVYHGAKGLKNIASRIHSIATYLSEALAVYGYEQENEHFFDTLLISLPKNMDVKRIREIALDNEVNLHYFATGEIGISIDETTTEKEVGLLLQIFATAANNSAVTVVEKELYGLQSFGEEFQRTSDFMVQEVFSKYQTETEMMRYIKKLERRDISLTHTMISLGSCTMKLNAAAELLSLSLPNFMGIHPLVPREQAEGYMTIIKAIESYLREITGLPGCTLQPNSGAAGEFTGLLMIRSYFEALDEIERDTILIPASAHGTNPASAIQAGYKIVVVKCDDNGNVDMEDWQEKAQQYHSQLAGCMITYPSTHGIFEPSIKEMCEIIHDNGGQVYLDGANMNAQVGLTHPGIIGADVCHLNLHKTFAIPHGGGGPGVGPICVARHLIPYLPDTHFGENTVASSPYGSAGILPITYGYIRMLGADGLAQATRIAILNANYLAEKVKETYGVVYTGANGRVGHELILECRKLKTTSGITETDIAKRLIDYGFHAPTLSFPVAGTLMIEPTESESLSELDKFAEALLNIFAEIKAIETNEADKTDNLLKNAPHPEYEIVGDGWTHPYTRSTAAYPTESVRENKFWVNVARVDNGYGDRNLICNCISMEEWQEIQKKE